MRLLEATTTSISIAVVAVDAVVEIVFICTAAFWSCAPTAQKSSNNHCHGSAMRSDHDLLLLRLWLVLLRS
jgi:hypothetical protein